MTTRRRRHDVNLHPKAPPHTSMKSTTVGRPGLNSAATASEQCRSPFLTPGMKITGLNVVSVSTSHTCFGSREYKAACFDFVADQCVLPLSVYLLWILPYRCQSGALGASESLGFQLQLLATTVEVAGVVVSEQPYDKLEPLVLPVLLLQPFHVFDSRSRCDLSGKRKYTCTLVHLCCTMRFKQQNAPVAATYWQVRRTVKIHRKHCTSKAICRLRETDGLQNSLCNNSLCTVN